MIVRELLLKFDSHNIRYCVYYISGIEIGLR